MMLDEDGSCCQADPSWRRIPEICRFESYSLHFPNVTQWQRASSMGSLELRVQVLPFGPFSKTALQSCMRVWCNGYTCSCQEQESRFESCLSPQKAQISFKSVLSYKIWVDTSYTIFLRCFAFSIYFSLYLRNSIIYKSPKYQKKSNIQGT